MAITEFQRGICKLIAQNRIAQGIGYVSCGVTLNELINSSRISMDIDLFHDTDGAVQSAWEEDRALLTNAGYIIDIVRMMPAYSEAPAKKGAETVLMQWAKDSAFRFFPLIEDDTFGPTSLLAEAKRSSHYSPEEVAQLIFDGPPPDASLLGEEWHEHAGNCVLDGNANLYRGSPDELAYAREADTIRFHKGTLMGAYPKLLA